MSALDMYSVTFSADGIADVTALLDETPANIPSGYGGWTVISRARRVGVTVWQGKDPIRLAIAILFDGLIDRTSQELAISRLSRMALPPKGGGEPPVVTWDAAGVPKPGPTKWVIENLQWGTSKVVWDFANNGVMARLRQDCVVNLLEYRADDRTAFKGILPGSSKSTNAGASKSGWPKRYVVKAGDTLAKIAIHFYGDSKKWKDIADANGIRDPAIVASGQYKGKTIIIPAP